MTGPYVSGQTAASCGHYYPDVLRLRDEKKPDGQLVRIIDCTYCGRYEIPLDAKTLEKPLVHTLNEYGVEIGIREEELAEVRNRALRRFGRGTQSENRVAELLQDILEEAIHVKADAVELEYDDEGLIVTNIVGHIGMGDVIKDRQLSRALIALIVERAKLANKPRGEMEWNRGKEIYKIRVTEYDSFGETAYRLRVGHPKPKNA
jgi:hypothetical protein